jgi:hypothetical protein
MVIMLPFNSKTDDAVDVLIGFMERCRLSEISKSQFIPIQPAYFKDKLFMSVTPNFRRKPSGTVMRRRMLVWFDSVYNLDPQKPIKRSL